MQLKALLTMSVFADVAAGRFTSFTSTSFIVCSYPELVDILFFEALYNTLRIIIFCFQNFDPLHRQLVFHFNSVMSDWSTTILFWFSPF